VRLQRELNSLQHAARKRRDSLFARQKHLHDARAWCDASRTTH
jgi:hypothetical protein